MLNNGFQYTPVLSIATVSILHAFSHSTSFIMSAVIVPKILTRAGSECSGTATTCSLSLTSIPAAYGFTIDISITVFAFVFFDFTLLIVIFFKNKSSLPECLLEFTLL
jgi:hypothetical protein